MDIIQVHPSGMALALILIDTFCLFQSYKAVPYKLLGKVLKAINYLTNSRIQADALVSRQEDFRERMCYLIQFYPKVANERIRYLSNLNTNTGFREAASEKIQWNYQVHPIYQIVQ